MFVFIRFHIYRLQSWVGVSKKTTHDVLVTCKYALRIVFTSLYRVTDSTL